MRILTVTCNPAADTTYLLDRLVPGEINRVERVLPAPGGKGNNVARVLARLGQQPVATGFVGGRAGAFIVDGLRIAGVEPAFVSVTGETRTCLTIVEHDTGRATEIREPGPIVANQDADRLVAHVRELLAGAGAVAISGSLPPGAPTDLYARLIREVKSAGVFVALDSSDEAFRSGVATGPDLIKPNVDELADLLGASTSPDELMTLAREALVAGTLPVVTILLSMGARGAALIGRDLVCRAVPPEVEAVNPVGSGDALLAGFLDARARGVAEVEALAHAVAVGTANACAEGVGSVSISDVARIRPRVTLDATAIPATPASRAGSPASVRPVQDAALR